MIRGQEVRDLRRQVRVGDEPARADVEERARHELDQCDRVSRVLDHGGDGRARGVLHACRVEVAQVAAGAGRWARSEQKAGAEMPDPCDVEGRGTPATRMSGHLELQDERRSWNRMSPELVRSERPGPGVRSADPACGIVDPQRRAIRQMKVLEVQAQRSRDGGVDHRRPYVSAAARPADRADRSMATDAGQRPAREIRKVDDRPNRLDDPHTEPPRPGRSLGQGNAVGAGELDGQGDVEPGRDLAGDEPRVLRPLAADVRVAIEGPRGTLECRFVGRGNSTRRDEDHDRHRPQHSHHPATMMIRSPPRDKRSRPCLAGKHGLGWWITGHRDRLRSVAASSDAVANTARPATTAGICTAIAPLRGNCSPQMPAPARDRGRFLLVFERGGGSSPPPRTSSRPIFRRFFRTSSKLSPART